MKAMWGIWILVIQRFKGRRNNFCWSQEKGSILFKKAYFERGFLPQYQSSYLEKILKKVRFGVIYARYPDKGRENFYMWHI
jgi:hypothetical protein